jgi:predicted nucleotidyltransferase
LSQKIAQAADAYGIRLALLFGSAVSGRMHAGSDVDVAILLQNPDLPPGRYAELYHELQHALPDRDLDLALLNRADPLFLKKITESCRLLYGDVRDLQKLKILAFRRYQDHRRFLRLEREYVQRFIREARGHP